MRRKTGLGLTVAFALVTLPALAAGRISHPTPYDPVLDGPPPGPCDPQSYSAATVSGTDVYGRPVAPADVSPRPVVQMGSENLTPEVLVHLPNMERLRASVRLGGLADAVAQSNEGGCLPQKPQPPAPDAGNPDRS